MYGVPILEFPPFHGEEEDVSDHNFLLNVKPIHPSDESIHADLEEPDIPILKKEISNLLNQNACSERKSQFKRPVESPSDYWNGEASDRIVTMSKNYNDKKLELYRDP
uniref:Uncharacterized protein n=1 Tax=Lepeophtheirus salmonis TaxID=72036 RepID=A0A0K2TYX0_LEPSM